ncbi:MAG TPA: hypothetical protein RMH99_08290 [Sandaracinaceae bacterium LLY-WYZ-13_1]|nr:hypothetical protein [Sandaracinaceae bacterium LLY-WYZ-13_1]
MELAVLLALVAVLVFGAVAYLVVKPRVEEDEIKQSAWALYEQVAAEVGGLVVAQTDEGWPRLEGLVDGLTIEIDHTNLVAPGLEGLLGMRCQLPEAEKAPNGAVWVGHVDGLHTQFGRPRPLGDGAGLFEVYTRVEPGASDWWQEAELREVLEGLPGAGVALYEGQLTVVFTDLDAESVRTAMRVPGLIRRGVRRVTLH